jgi:uncharacterized oxidoreductase
MKTTGNTILITGGGSGIGRGLAAAFHALGNTVIISGRRRQALDETIAAYPGMHALPFDIDDPASIRGFAEQLGHQFPQLNVLVNNAGIMRPEKLDASDIDLDTAEATITTNLLGPMRLTAALLPLLRRQPVSTVMTVSSGLAFVPMTATPTYSATKAAIHSWSQSLRYQLKATTTEVIEIIPPYVQTELMGQHQTTDPRAMPLDAYIDEAMEILKTQPEVKEVCVERVGPLRFAAERGSYDKVFQGMNAAAH